ncbi:YfhE family protein [Bacillus taeanensis]|uniref:YfhE family protein n=1 Tax=Bacillus taeanensis TaxID=273032 RepID=A0A366XVL0_9BACI|nr:YfhE family protein [Bacillus taeanensis]RBW68193.1 YfhE family protein [Bacillus taeanensis]
MDNKKKRATDSRKTLTKTQEVMYGHEFKVADRMFNQKRS